MESETLTQSNGAVSRRAFIRVAAGGAAMTAFLAACTSASTPASPTAAPPAPTAAPKPTAAAASLATPAAAAPAAPTAAPAAAVATKPAAAAVAKNPALPNYFPVTTGPKPDYPSAGQQYEDGWDNYPYPAPKSWTKDPPGNGSTINVLTNMYNPPSAAYDQNPTWQAVNKALNATVQFTVVPPADYAAKLSAAMAGSDLPDLMAVSAGLNTTQVANLPQFLQAKCADLTPYLAGDAIKDYPNLAAIPTFAWQNSGSAFQGKLYMLPLERYQTGTALFKIVEVYDKEIGADVVPKNAADLKKIYQALNKPSEGQWATASFNNQGFFIPRYYSAMWGAPLNWRLNPDGSLTKDYETPEYKAAIAYVQDLYQAGVFHPKTLQYTDINSARLDFVGSKFVLYPEGFGQPWQDFARRGLQMNPPVTYQPLPPFPAQDGGKAQHFLGAGFLITNMIKAGSPDRIKEILRVLDYLAAPFGTQEDILLQYGLQDVDYTMDGTGKITLTEQSNPHANYVNWKYMEQHPQVMYVPDIPGYAKSEYNAEHFLLPVGVSDPTWGMYSATAGQKNTPLAQAVIDGMTDIVAGRRPISDWDGIVANWRSSGGDQMRKEFQDAIAQANK